jgi:hypothetical protein
LATRTLTLFVTAFWFLSAGASHADIKPADPAKKTALQVRHLDQKVDDWQVAETSHFRIMHNQPKELVDRVGRVAEDTRLKLQKKWFGDDAIDWDGRCSIYLHSDRAKYTAKAGIPNALGHTRTFSWGKDIQSRSIHLPAQQPKMLEDVLPHEVSHSVLAVRFQGKTPRWADEGMAMLAETPPAIAECVGRLKQYKKDHNLFALDILMQTDETDHFQSLEYYSQSASLVQFLTGLKGPQVFTGFLQTSIAKDYPSALKQHYEITGFSDLQKRWQDYAFKKTK